MRLSLPTVLQQKKRANRPPASIKGVFVQSHVRRLREQAGEAAVAELEKRFGAPVSFGALEDVPVRNEVRLIEIVLDLTRDHHLAGAARAEAAGRLHFSNFSQPTLGTMLIGTAARTPQSFIGILRVAPTIARTVFSNINFHVQEHGDCLAVTIDNCDYPPEHFAGFFAEWMRQWGLQDTEVRTSKGAPGVFTYWLYFNRS